MSVATDGEPDLAGDRWLMIFGTILMFGTMFGAAALAGHGLVLIGDGRAHPGLALVLAGVVGLAIVNTHDAIGIVLRPDRRRARLALLRAVLLFGPAVILMTSL